VSQQSRAAHVRILQFLSRIRFELRQALVPNWLRGEEQAWQRWQVLRWTIRIVVILGIPILTGYAYGITLWDWMNLLIVPLVIAGIGIWFNSQQRAGETENTERRTQDDALDTYLKDMTTLLVDKK
jgi:hypothetical protein